jgi:TatD DNase family protein
MQTQHSIPLVDSHIHLHEFDENTIKRLCSEDYVFLAVSDDFLSSAKTVEIAKRCRNVVPAVGVHPWVIKEDINIESIAKLVSDEGIRFLGEVGLDKRFVPQTFELQLKIFKEFLEIAKTYGLGLSIHAPDAWREVLELLVRNDIKVAVFHWYTGPLDLIKEIIDAGYYIGINAAAKIQKKHLEVIGVVPLEYMVTESDGPYNYRGLLLEPSLLPDLLDIIARVKGVSTKEVRDQIWQNFLKILRIAGASLHL